MRAAGAARSAQARAAAGFRWRHAIGSAVAGVADGASCSSSASPQRRWATAAAAAAGSSSTAASGTAAPRQPAGGAAAAVPPPPPRPLDLAALHRLLAMSAALAVCAWMVVKLVMLPSRQKLLLATGGFTWLDGALLAAVCVNALWNARGELFVRLFKFMSGIAHAAKLAEALERLGSQQAGLREDQQAIKAAQEAARADQQLMRADVGDVKAGVQALKTDLADLRAGQKRILGKLDELGAQMENHARGQRHALQSIDRKLEALLSAAQPGRKAWWWQQGQHQQQGW